MKRAVYGIGYIQRGYGKWFGRSWKMKPFECSGCPLEELGQGFVRPFGTGSSGISLVGMAPAAQELIAGIPFVGRAGSVLSKVLSKIGAREEFSISNTLQCRPPKDNWDESDPWALGAEAHCGIHRRAAKDRFNPKINVALGAIPFRVLTGKTTPISKARGYRYEGLDGTPVIATYHPSFLGRGKMNLIPVVTWDILTAQREIGKPAPMFPFDALELQPGPASFADFCVAALNSEFIAVDLETEDSPGDEEDLEIESHVITRASMALDEAHGFRAITWPWQEPFTSNFVALMRYRNEKVFHNGWDFDIPRLAEVGIVPAGRWQDTMWLWHALQPTLPRGLGAITPFYARCPEWKSLGSRGADPELYSAMDAWATAKCFVGLKRVMERRKI